MKTLVLRSKKSRKQLKLADEYLQEFDTRFAGRVLRNLRDDPGFCTVCGRDCIACRRPYGRKLRNDVAGIIDFSSILPYVLEHPHQFVPRHVHGHDVLLVINIHEQILLEVLKVCKEWGTRGVVVPLEAPGWMTHATMTKAYRICEETGVEIAFPKPFCTFQPPQETVLAEFREHFHIGRPDVALEIEGGRISKAHVNVSAACGATYCVARWLEGRRTDENLEIEVVSRRWHAYPCTASMERDPELNDETPLHVAGQAHYAILKQVKDKVAGLEDPVVRSPLGTMVQRPIPPRENLANIEKAKALILMELNERDEVTLAELRRSMEVSPVALNSAVVTLKREGRIAVEGTSVVSR